jgi:hypothetical protein
MVYGTLELQAIAREQGALLRDLLPNWLSFLSPVIGWLPSLGPIQPHVKNINYPPEVAQRTRSIGQDYGKYCCALDEGNLDVKRVAGILRASGYNRDLCIENESLGKHPPEQKLAVLRRDVDAARAAIAWAQTAGSPKSV